MILTFSGLRELISRGLLHADWGGIKGMDSLDAGIVDGVANTLGWAEFLGSDVGAVAILGMRELLSEEELCSGSFGVV